MDRIEVLGQQIDQLLKQKKDLKAKIKNLEDKNAKLESELNELRFIWDFF